MSAKSINVWMTAKRIGKMPSLHVSPMGIFAAIGASGMGAFLSMTINGDPVASAVVGSLSACSLWVANRYVEKVDNNDGWHWLTDPIELKQSVAKRSGAMDAALTGIYRDVFKCDSIVVENKDEHPRFVVHVIHHDDVHFEDRKRLRKLAIKLGIETEIGREPPFQIVFSWGGGASAIVIPKFLGADEKPTIIPFDESKVQRGKLVSYLGDDIRGRAIRNNRELAAHMMISGMTGSGKTILFRNEIFSMALAAPNAIIYSIDYKGGIRSAPHTKFTSNMVEGLKLLAELKEIAAGNWEKIQTAGLDNWFEYEEAHPGVLPPIFLNIDEYPQFIAEGDRAILEQWEIDKIIAKENGEPKPIKPPLVNDLVGEFLRVFRSYGCFVTIGIQKPKADIIPTPFGDMFDARAAMRVSDGDASRVAIDINGAQDLPDRGGVMFRIASQPIQIGAAAFMTSAQRTRLMSEIFMQ